MTSITHSKKTILTRYPGNPIITGEMMPFNCRGVYNSSAVRFGDGYVMVLRAEGYNLIDTFWLAHSDDGYAWRIGDMIPLPEDDPEYKQFGHNQYDPRVTRIGDTFYITFCVHGMDVRMGLMSTPDFKNFKWEGFITGSGFRNTVLFPEKANGLYLAFERPNETGDIWLTQSPDLRFWGQQKLVLAYREVPWAWGKIGPCGTPMRTEKGWLSIFHGVQVLGRHHLVYHAGIMLTDLNEPWKLIRFGNEPILSPEVDYELSGHIPTTVFASSQVVEPDGRVKVYYGASDRYQCVADTTIDLLLEAALER
ncbi:MAG: glycoside hydrolase family 130 protein [Anaerolineales bacterium]|nr:glycoside hydrolase family 130 protein [Anaerolineales bacterium]